MREGRIPGEQNWYNFPGIPNWLRRREKARLAKWTPPNSETLYQETWYRYGQKAFLLLAIKVAYLG